MNQSGLDETLKIGSSLSLATIYSGRLKNLRDIDKCSSLIHCLLVRKLSVTIAWVVFVHLGQIR